MPSAPDAVRRRGVPREPAAEPPAVTVDVGPIRLVGASEAAPPPRGRAQRPAPSLSLADYLRVRNAQ